MLGNSRAISSGMCSGLPVFLGSLPRGLVVVICPGRVAHDIWPVRPNTALVDMNTQIFSFL